MVSVVCKNVHMNKTDDMGDWFEIVNLKTK